MCLAVEVVADWQPIRYLALPRADDSCQSMVLACSDHPNRAPQYQAISIVPVLTGPLPDAIIPLQSAGYSPI